MWKSISFLALAPVLICCKESQKSNSKSISEVHKTVPSPEIQQNAEHQPAGYSAYKGAWFEVECPAVFSAKGSEKSTSTEGFDSAIFTSPDGRVQFYVYAPQWHGQPKDIQLSPGEKIIDKREANNDNITVKRWTILNKNQDQTRSYEETIGNSGTVNKIFGITYATSEDLEKYREAYLHFKSSLKQFAD